MPLLIGFHFTARNQQGVLLQTSKGAEPHMFLSEHGQVIPGLERELLKLETQEVATFVVRAEDGYGEITPDHILRVKRDRLPPGIEVGAQFTVRADGGGPVFTVREIGPVDVTIDGNHPLAGDLVFEVEIVGKWDATPEDIAEFT